MARYRVSDLVGFVQNHRPMLAALVGSVVLGVGVLYPPAWAMLTVANTLLAGMIAAFVPEAFVSMIATFVVMATLFSAVTAIAATLFKGFVFLSKKLTGFEGKIIPSAPSTLSLSPAESENQVHNSGEPLLSCVDDQTAGIEELFSTSNVAIASRTSSPAISMQEAVLRKTPTPTSELEAVLRKTPTPTLDQEVVLRQTSTPTSELEVVLRKTPTPTLELEAVLRKTPTPTLDQEVVLRQTPTPTSELEVVLRKTPTPTSELEVVLRKTPTPTLEPEAILRNTSTPASEQGIVLTKSSTPTSEQEVAQENGAAHSVVTINLQKAPLDTERQIGASVLPRPADNRASRSEAPSFFLEGTASASPKPGHSLTQ